MKDNVTKYPLQSAHKAPYKVLKHFDKHFSIVINVFIVCLKPAHLDNITDNFLNIQKRSSEANASKSRQHSKGPKKLFLT